MRELAAASRAFCGLWGLVPGGGVEPPRPEGRRILSPLRLPVPPSRRLLQGQKNQLNRRVGPLQPETPCPRTAGHHLRTNHSKMCKPESACLYCEAAPSPTPFDIKLVASLNFWCGANSISVSKLR
jgi:hypothetical protein